MATHQISILNASAAPDNSGRVWFEPMDVMGANDQWKYMVLVFGAPSGTQAHGIYGAFTVPQNFVGNADIQIIWNSSATSGNIRSRFSYRAVGGDNAESLDQAGTQESVNGTDTVSSTARRRMVQSLALTSANLAAGDTLQFYLERYDDGSNLDTMAASSYIHDVIFDYTDV